MPSALRACVLATLLAPVHVFFAGPRALTPRAVRHPALRVPAVVASDEDMTSAYRTLGLTDEATYDEIMDTYVELSEAYAADPARLGALEKAKEAVLDDRLRQRMAGTLKANYEGMQSIDDRPPEKRTPIWVHANNFRKKMILKPSPKYALNVFAILGGLTFATWLAPTTAGTILLINVASGMGFIYNRGEADVVRDDFGQIGEVRPLKPKPFLLTVAITTAIWLSGYFKAKQIVATVANPPRTLELVLRTTLISLGLMIPALFVRVHSIFD